ncbi:peptide deformylase [Streptomyces sp. NPDC102406]|uniref:peptide deformylase n=1 Tax=Streptomyces sp. NPDC102406 TaxID=3366171 RepID=UPI00380D15A4
MPPMSLSERAEALLDAATLPLVLAGDPVLRRPAEPYDGQLPDALLNRLIERMRATMHAAPGVGLAAPQIGLPLRLAVIEDEWDVPAELRRARGRAPQPFRVLINPSYDDAGGRRVAFYEGCLSVPGYQAVVARHERVRLRALDERGRAVDEEIGGWPARIVQHETDHLDGTLYLDRAELRSLASVGTPAQKERWNQPTPRLAAQELGFDLPPSD